ncbi:MAG: ABC transporter ATP-binding protein [Phycisphaerae bacterium]|nr:ABC transporter ATP-binding protein [Phycisphaerae bacterium]
MAEPILEARNLHRTYVLGRTRLHVLRGVDLAVAPGEFVAIMGSSGSGKSTLLHILGALDIPQRGQVCFRQQPVFPDESHRIADRRPAANSAGADDVPSMTLDATANRLRNEAFGFVFQFYHLLPEYDVLENTLLPHVVGLDAAGWFASQREIRGRAVELLASLGLGDRISHRPNELSGGERQRVAIARALIHRPAVLLADEPTGNLDSATGREILGVLQRLTQAGQTIVMVTHDAEIARQAHRIVRLSDGRVVQ